MRPTKDEYFLRMAKLVATRSTCVRRQAGCVLVDKNGFILATGYNGVPAGHEHCIDTPCPGAGYPKGEGYDKCEATHAEVNAFLQCPDAMKVHTCYVTTTPCLVNCIKLLFNSGCERIVASEEHPAMGESLARWVAKGKCYKLLDID